MKLIIDIPDNYDLSKIQNGSIASKIILNAVANGTPLDSLIADIRTEIGWRNSAAYMGEYNVGLRDALKVIDKYTKRLQG